MSSGEQPILDLCCLQLQLLSFLAYIFTPLLQFLKLMSALFITNCCILLDIANLTSPFPKVPEGHQMKGIKIVEILLPGGGGCSLVIYDTVIIIPYKSY